MALAPEDIKATKVSHLVCLGGALLLEPPELGSVELVALVGVEVQALGTNLVASQALGIASENDVDATTCHVRGDGDRVQPPSLGDDHSLLGVVLCVQHVMWDALFVEKHGKLLGLGHRRRADENGLAQLESLL